MKKTEARLLKNVKLNNSPMDRVRSRGDKSMKLLIARRNETIRDETRPSLVSCEALLIAAN